MRIRCMILATLLAAVVAPTVSAQNNATSAFQPISADKRDGHECAIPVPLRAPSPPGDGQLPSEPRNSDCTNRERGRPK